ncbi:MAG: hypothetical protein EDM69_07065 [Chlorobiota bacterium]|nr:MAG: hypothetical protein EDM69_07065 [Chlorobiota bacterium]MBV6399266.1 Protein TolB [Ignavibacteria bacterium]MCE7953530.1 hypothetical protein [Chlorobi bacterium CHB7]RIK49281.1 MAG: hypothetical protein DCC60_04850 [Ignavibacteriota bacterium]
MVLLKEIPKMRFTLLTIITSLFIFSHSFAQPKITYVSSDNSTGLLQVFTMNVDGSSKRQITNVPFNCMFPRWSPDGNKIVFRTDDGRIYMVDNVLSDNASEPLFVFGGDNPVFSHSGDEIIFSGDHAGVTTLYIMKPTDPDAEPISPIDFSTQQVISNDGRYIVFSGFDEGSKCIFRMDVDDESDDYISKISVNGNANLEPDISSDNQKYVYASFNNNLQGTIYICENGVETPLTKGITSASQPKFSPDDKYIGFVSIEDTNIEFNIMLSDGSGKKKFNVKGGNIGVFRWIDNQTIVYDADEQNLHSIGTLNIVTGENNIIANSGMNLHPDVFVNSNNESN